MKGERAEGAKQTTWCLDAWDMYCLLMLVPTYERVFFVAILIVVFFLTLALFVVQQTKKNKLNKRLMSQKLRHFHARMWSSIL